MSEVTFIDADGIVRLRGTLEPPPGGAQTIEQVLTEGNDANGYDLLNVGQLTTNGSGIQTQGSDIKTSGGDIDTAVVGGGPGGGGINTNGGSLDLSTGSINCGDISGGEFTADSLLVDGAAFGRAAFVDPLTATPGAICTALIAAGLMAAS